MTRNQTPKTVVWSSGAKTSETTFVNIGAGIRLETPLEWTAAPEGVPFDFEVRAVLEDGRYVVERLTVRRMEEDGKPVGPPVTNAGLRLVPVAQLLREDLNRAVTASANFWSDERRRPTGEELLEAGPTDESLEHIAAVYRLAYAVGYTPTKAVAETLGTSRATAGRWVAKARERGFLGPAAGTKAGEASTPEGD